VRAPRPGILAALLLGLCGGLFAADYGLTLHQSAEISGAAGDNPVLNLVAGAGPWFSSYSHESLDLYLSGFLNMQYEYDGQSGEGGWRFIPELGRFSLLMRPLGGLRLEIGRLRYSDPNGLVLSGLLDGFSGTLDIGHSRLSLGSFYTGLLYRDTARIYMTAPDSSWNDALGKMNIPLAGRRLITALDWELPSLFQSSLGLNLNLLGQADLNGAEEALHSQYLSLKLAVSPLPSLYAALGGVLGLAEYRTGDGGEPYWDLNLALNFNLDWDIPGGPRDALSFGLAWGSGKHQDSVLGPYRSVTLFSSSNILSAGMAGLAALRLNYTVRLRENLSLGLDGRYFIRGNLDTLDTLALAEDREKRALGGEFYGSLIWVPLSDLSLVLGGGLFIPAMGNALKWDEAPRWEASCSLAFSL
jgi:hypothetical protein